MILQCFAIRHNRPCYVARFYICSTRNKTSGERWQSRR